MITEKIRKIDRLVPCAHQQCSVATLKGILPSLDPNFMLQFTILPVSPYRKNRIEIGVVLAICYASLGSHKAPLGRKESQFQIYIISAIP